MQASTLADLMVEPAVKDDFKATLNRWDKMQATFQGSVEKIANGDAGALETTDRMRAAVIRAAKDPKMNPWLSITGSPKGMPNGQSDDEKIEKFANSLSIDALRKLGEEAQIGQSDYITVEFFERGLKAAESVGRISSPISMGTGFLVGNGFLMTNHHVIPTVEKASIATLDMNLEDDVFGETKAQERFSFDPDSFFYTDPKLDVTIVAVNAKSMSSRKRKVSDFGYLPLIRSEGKILRGWNVNIVQHPTGGNKQVSFRNGVLVEIQGPFAQSELCYYTADTGKGSSGSPVFNDSWEVVALHHHALPDMDAEGHVLDRQGKRITEREALEDPTRVNWVANEGTRVSRIVAAFEAAQLEPKMAGHRDQLLALWVE